MDYDDLKMCNCAECGRLLLGSVHRMWRNTLTLKQQDSYPPLVSGRINGRPYCRACLYLNTVRGRDGARYGLPRSDNDPAQDNAVRRMEDND